MTVNNETYGNLTPKKLRRLLDELRSGARGADEVPAEATRD